MESAIEEGILTEINSTKIFQKEVTWTLIIPNPRRLHIHIHRDTLASEDPQTPQILQAIDKTICYSPELDKKYPIAEDTTYLSKS